MVAVAVVVLAGTSGTVLLARDAGGPSGSTPPVAVTASPSVPPPAPATRTATPSASPSPAASAAPPSSARATARATATPGPGIVATLPPYAGPSPEAILTGPTPPPAPQASRVTPDRLSWGLTAPGHQSKQQPVVVLNTGGQPLHVFPVGITGDNAGDFRIVTDSCSGTDVAPQQECSIEIVYDPRTAGDARAELLVSDDSGGSPTGGPTKTSSVPLSGTAG